MDPRFILTGTRQYRAGECGRKILSIRKYVMNQRNKRENAKGHVLQWFVVMVELKKRVQKTHSNFVVMNRELKNKLTRRSYV